MINQIDWGIVTKYPGDEKDYRLLACSELMDTNQNYHSLIRKWMVGELPFEGNNREAGSPWYIFGIIQNPLRQVIIEQKWTNYSDRHRRPVQKMTCLLIPFEGLSASACGYHQMVDLFNENNLKANFDEIDQKLQRNLLLQPEPKLEVNLPDRESSIEETLKIISILGVEKCLTLANILLQKPLALLWRDEKIPDWSERLLWLDGIMAFLPYGLRADCPASIWVSTGEGQNMRLYWAGKALEQHSSAWIGENELVDSSTEDCDYIKRERLILRHTEIQNHIRFLAMMGQPLAFEDQLSASVLEDIGKIFVVQEELSETNYISPVLFDSALDCIQKGQINNLSAQDQSQFVLKLLPSIELEFLPKLVSGMNQDAVNEIMATFLRGEFDQSPDRYRILRSIIQLFLHSNQTKPLLKIISEEVEKKRINQLDILQILVHLADDSAQITEVSQLESSYSDLATLLQKLISKFTFTEDDLLIWISLIAQKPHKDQIAAFSNFMEEIKEEDESSFLGIIHNIWVDSEKNASVLNQNIITKPVSQLIGIVQSIILNHVEDINFIPLLTKIRTSQNYLDKSVRSRLIDLLNLPILDFINLDGSECAIFDKLRLENNLPELCLISLLQEDEKSSIEEYIQQFRPEYQYRTENDPIDFNQQFQNIISNSLREIEFTTNVNENLAFFSQKFADLYHLPNNYHQLILPHLRGEIENAIHASSSTDEISQLCEPLLIDNDMASGFLESNNWKELIRIFSENHYPQTAKELWRLVDLFSAYLTKNGKGGLEIETLFHEAVLRAGGLLSESSEKRSYMSELLTRARKYVENTKYAWIERKMEGEQISISTLEDFLLENLRYSLRHR